MKCYAKNIVKKILYINIGIVTIICMFFPFLAFAQSNQPAQIQGENLTNAYIENLRTIGFPVDEILQAQVISRYDVTRLLNAVECIDCIRPGAEQINAYTEPFWQNFVTIPGEDFRDILFQQALYREGSYYYCVAYAADNEYMNGFPVATSPICGGLFCGTKNTTKAEFLQIIVNVIEKFTFQKYTINWQEVQERRQTQAQGTYPERYMNTLDDETIQAGLARCGNTACPLADRREFKTYRKYCTFELEKCENRTFGFLETGWRPVAELNVLEKENILIDPNIQDTIHDPVDGPFVLETFGRLFPIIACEFDLDYDCDNLANTIDSCPNAYNPSQRDLDNDGIGNVCDDDIDGDGVTNPIGIVDDNDTVIISKYDPTMDNCLFVQNPDQKDANGNKKGDACDGLQDHVSLRIEPILEQKSGPLSLGLQARTLGTHGVITRDMGDGQEQQGETIIHQYDVPGSYTVIAKTAGLRNDAIAKTTIIVGESLQEQFGIQPTTQMIHSETPLSFSLSNEILSNQSLPTTLYINDQKDKQYTESSIEKTLTTPGSYRITNSIHQPNDEKQILAANQYHIGIGSSNMGSMLTSESLIYETNQTITLTTIIQGDENLNPISYIVREFGDGEEIKTNNLNHQKVYTDGGKKVVLQHIVREDGTIHTNFLTIYIQGENSKQNNTSLALKATPGFIQAGENVLFETVLFNTPTDSIIKKIIQFDDETSETRDANTTSQNKSYTIPGIYFPSVTYNIDTCRTLHASATVIATENNSCLDALLNGTLDQFVCDMDNDSIPDICDEDIDGDGIMNEVGTILFENDDCSINASNINPQQTKKHLEGVCLLDNCPFTENPEQIDLNNNAIGDDCPDLIPYTDSALDPSERDTDGDGYNDLRDACRTLPENFNNVEDGDGCPEIGENDPCNTIMSDPFINAVHCNSCPCHFADFGEKLKKGDKVRAILTDKPGQVDYTRSFPKIVE